jgi:NTP pyrophosphatase (non-canonical NTP hydrolase)
MSSSVHAEALSILIEECAEVTQAATKIMRFGTGSEWDGVTNISRLESEIGDLLAMIDILVNMSIVEEQELLKYKEMKFDRLKSWSNINPMFLKSSHS